MTSPPNRARGVARVPGPAPVGRASVPGAAAEGGEGALKARKKRRRRKRVIAAVAVLVMLVGVGTIGGTFYFTSVKLPGELPTPQASTILYGNGTQMARHW